MHDELFFLLDRTDEVVPPLASPHRRGATETLAAFSLEATLGRGMIRRIVNARSLAMVVEVPSAEWIKPIRTACLALANWDDTISRSGASRTEDRPDKGNNHVAQLLAGGGRVLGVSQACDRYLPSALVQAADLRVRVQGPTDAVIARVIRAATGGRVPVPPGIAEGVTFSTICSSVRIGSTPRSCVDRILAAREATMPVDPGVAAAPDFATLAGYGPAHAWGMRLLSGVEAWRTSGGAFPRERNVVLASEPGLGKTTFVRALAKSCRLPLVSTSVSSWFTQSNGCLDGVLKSIEELFSGARSRPTIVFIDELDGVPNRATLSERNREWWTPVVGSLLLHIERLYADPDAKVCVIGATNFENRLDAALVRPGRLNRVIRIEKPSTKDLAAILRQHLGEDLPALDLEPIAGLGAGATGAQAVAWVEEARNAAGENGRCLAPSDLVDAVAPRDDRSPAAIRRSAIHEAAHAVSMELLGVGEVQRVDVINRCGAGGLTNALGLLGTMPTRADLERLVITFLAGRAAEAAFLGEASAGAGGSVDSDLGRATSTVVSIHASLGLGKGLAYRGHGDGFAEAILRADPNLTRVVEADLARLQAAAADLIAVNRALVGAVAERLVASRAIDGVQLRAIIGEHRDAPEASAGRIAR